MPTRQEQLQIVVAHTLPGRLRLRLSHPPHSVARMVRMVESPPGVQSVAYTAETDNMLILFDTKQITLEEIILRASLCLSADYRLQSVIIKSLGGKVPLSALALFSGLTILIGQYLAWGASKSNTLKAAQMVCGLSTTAAVSEHIYLDLKNKGQIHPEVLSIGYLLTSFLRGNILKGASIAWLMTFARHLLEPPEKVVKLKAKATDPACDDDQCEYEAKISRELKVKGYAGMLAGIPKLVLGMVTDMHLTAEDKIFKEIQRLSHERNDVLEGLENLQRGIRLQVGS